jgi:AcrR family transcriptional regulator
MPRLALTSDEILDFRRRATQAAMHLFAEQGYQAVTMRAVGAALEVSAMTPYRYFVDKEALFSAVRAEAFRRFADRLTAALQGRGDAMARLRRLKQAYIEFALEQPDAYRIMFELRQPEASRQPEVVKESRRGFGALARAVAEAVAAGDLNGDFMTIAHLLWAGAHGLVSLHLAGKLVSGRTLVQLAAVDHELEPFRNPRKKKRRSR